MANIKQQKKRNRRSLKQRDTNIRYRSTVRSGMKRLTTAVTEGESITPEQAAEMVKKWSVDKAFGMRRCRDTDMRKKTNANTMCHKCKK